jgi:predicted DNA-binding WGR domain protein
MGICTFYDAVEEEILEYLPSLPDLAIHNFLSKVLSYPRIFISFSVSHHQLPDRDYESIDVKNLEKRPLLEILRWVLENEVVQLIQSTKFWNISLKYKRVITNYGKKGSKGQEKIKTFETQEEAIEYTKARISEKKKAGYKLKLPFFIISLKENSDGVLLGKLQKLTCDSSL